MGEAERGSVVGAVGVSIPEKADRPGGVSLSQELEAELNRIGKLVEAAPVEMLKLVQTEPDPNQPRTAIDEADIDVLAENISKVGLLNPIHVYLIAPSDNPSKKRFRVDNGHRRRLALLRLGRTEAPHRILPPEVVANTPACSLARALRQDGENATPVGFSKWDEVASLARQLDWLNACQPNLSREDQFAWLASKKHVQETVLYSRLALRESPAPLASALRLPPNRTEALSWRGALSLLREARSGRKDAVKAGPLTQASKLFEAVAAAASITVPPLGSAEQLAEIRTTEAFERSLRDHCAERGERLSSAKKALDALVKAVGASDSAFATLVNRHLADGRDTTRTTDGQTTGVAKKSAAKNEGSEESVATPRARSHKAAGEDARTPADAVEVARQPTPDSARPAPDPMPPTPPLLFQASRGGRLKVYTDLLGRPDVATRENLLALDAALDAVAAKVREGLRLLDAEQADAEAEA